MLERPAIKDAQIIACLQKGYGVDVVHVAFLPLGADLNTAVYRVVAEDGPPYFLKLRRGIFDETSVTLPKFLSDQGIAEIIAPLATVSGPLWANVDAFKTILYPFVEGRNGYEVDLSDRQWIEFGAALKKIHTAVLPPALINRLQHETYAPQARHTVRAFLERIETDSFDDPLAVQLAEFLRLKRGKILDLVGRAERLAQFLQAQPSQPTLCHSDIHAGNLLIDADGALYIVDWDNPNLAPKERDLIGIGGGLMGNWRPPEQEELLFFQGYGEVQIDPRALAYYRYERIIQDIAVFCEQLFLTADGGEDRAQALRFLKSNFLPNHTIEIAYKSDKILIY